MKEIARGCIAKLVAMVPKGILIDDRFFAMFEQKGIHILPADFYQPIPNLRELRDEIWEKPSSLVGVRTELPKQVEFLRNVAARHLGEYHALYEDRSAEPSDSAFQFGGIDGAILYAMIRAYRPRRMIEIGAGSSTLLSLAALDANARDDGLAPAAFTSIEPYPSAAVRRALEHRGTLIADRVEQVPHSAFGALQENDILFIDSSHTVRIGGDVVYEMLEVLPRLNPGVLIHIHDIFLPQEYPKEWVRDRYVFWNEQYLFHAFMAFNSHFETLWSAGCMHVHHPEELAAYFPYYERTKQQAASYWIRRIR